MSGQKRLVGKDVIGIDEFHNGFHFNHSHHVDFPFLVGAYLCRSYDPAQPSYRFGRKSRVFSESDTRMSDEELAQRFVTSVTYNPHFLYLALSRKDFRLDMEYTVRARANAALILTLIRKYKLNPNNVLVVTDKADNKEKSSKIIERTRIFLEDKGANVQIHYQEHADTYNAAVKKIDRILYYLAGIKLRFPEAPWPLRHKKISLSGFNRTLVLDDVVDDQLSVLQEAMSK